MPFAIATIVIALLLIFVFLAFDWPSFLSNGKPNRKNKKDKSEVRPKQMPPGHRFNHYDHSDEAEHRTAEQYNWRRQNVLAGFTIIFAGVAAIFAVKTFIQTKRQADIAKRALIESDRPIAAIQMQGVDIEGAQHDGHISALANITNYGNKPAFLGVLFAQTTVGNLPLSAKTRCFVKDGINHSINAERATNTWACRSSNVATANEIRGIKTGENLIYFTAVFYYSSALGTKWRRIDKSYYNVALNEWIDAVEDGVGTDVVVDVNGVPIPDPD